ncbi:MAG TPA: double-strand break repair helicase AddA [Parvibaculum sp.]|uniref:double-strand break repair helicase AddA n=1 Tax=Parvibaculum sp. TaxID=2024848 RepID=UPI002CCF11F2|nr:double-strand break repair helicase AddA [Parvibaculum sp.]HMM15292.1 double-strand break repair helicase AddA [Parvibaculum sp.]
MSASGSRLETKKRPSADEQQLRASDPAASVWVSANAGSGKTHALTTRVARLLLAGTDPGRILCLTFTKAAAAEMSGRLYQRLGDWAVMEDERLAYEIAGIEGPIPSGEKIAFARKLFARAIETPGGLKIQTIHAFCERLLGRFPLEAGVPANFDILDDRSAADLMMEVRDGVLRRAGTAPGTPLGRALQLIVERVDEFAFGNLLTGITGERRAFAKLIAAFGSIEGAIEAVCKTLGVAVDETSESIRLEMAALPEDEMLAAAATLARGTKTDVDRSKALADFLADPQARLARLDAYKAIFLTAEDEPRKRLITNKLGEENPSVAAALQREQERIAGLVARLRAVGVAEATGAVFHLADAILADFERAKRARALLDYEDLITYARRLLHESEMAAWVLFKLDGGIDHILVDEAQDTSPEQWDVIAALTDEFLSGHGARGRIRTIFAVGDEKQSIFSFQGADPQRFADMHRHFEARVKAAELTWWPVRLVRSFRSVPQVLSAVDKVFAQEIANRGLTASGAVDMHIAHRELDAGLVEIWEPEAPDEQDEKDAWDAPLDYMNETAPPAKLARRIATTIRGWLDSGEPLAARGRPIRAGDILILVQRRNSFVSEMVRQLKELGVPVAGADRMVLTEQIAVMDLLALGRFVLMPDDDLTLATVLKSPLVGLGEEELFTLAWGRKGWLWQALSAHEGTGSRFGEAHALLAALLKRADFERPYEFYAELLAAEGGRRKLLARLGPDANDPIDEFLSLALEYERLHAPSLQGFLHWVERGASEIKRDMEQGRDEVRVMTVHGAKGLEADIVFMPDTCAAPSGRHDPPLLALPTDPKLFLWPVRRKDEDGISARAREAHRQAQGEEYRRLLYVAMTRARDRLYVCCYRGKTEPAPDCWYNLIAAALVPEAEEIALPDGGRIWRIEGEQRRVPVPDILVVRTETPPLPDWARQRAPAEPTPSRPLAPSRLPPENLPEPPVLSPLAGDGTDRYKRGKLIHRLLQTLPDLEEGLREEAARRFLAAPAHGLDPATQDEIADAVFAVLGEPAFAPVFSPGSRAEVAVVGRIEFAGKPTLISGQIDRLSVGETRILVVDYKTNRPGARSMKDVSPAYIAQMAAYRAVLGEIYPGREIVCALLWTDGPSLMEIPPALLDRALAASRPPGAADP